MKDIQKETARNLLRIRAVTLNTVAPYKYASGMLSPIYVDCRTLSSFPKERKSVIDSLAEHISYFFKDDVGILVGSGHSGISLTTYLSQRTKIPMAYVRASKKGHGKENQIEGMVKDKESALVISDIIGSEEHIPLTIRALKERGCEIKGVMCIFDLKLGIVDEFLKKEGVRLFSLTDINALLEVAFDEGYISQAELKEVEKWMANTKEWGLSRREAIMESIENIKTEAAKILLNIKAVTLNVGKPYRYTSGILSPIYCDNRLLMAYPDRLEKIIDYMLSIIIAHIGVNNIDVVGGTSTAGIPYAAILSERLNLPMIYIKKDIEEHGKYAKIEGVLRNNQRVLIVEDLISTGGSSFSAVETVREAGGAVSDCIAIFTYELEKANSTFSDGKCSLHTLTNFSTLMKVAETEKYITPAEMEKALEWNKDTAGWAKKMGYE